ncbi:MAG TPA: hypothetical protein VFD92_04805 [Candidatus Binatia bacterium]|nr:hypothetical protein [Candidatus Binatia bacterium]
MTTATLQLSDRARIALAPDMARTSPVACEGTLAYRYAPRSPLATLAGRAGRWLLTAASAIERRRRYRHGVRLLAIARDNRRCERAMATAFVRTLRDRRGAVRVYRRSGAVAR